MKTRRNDRETIAALFSRRVSETTGEPPAISLFEEVDSWEAVWRPLPATPAAPADADGWGDAA